MKFMSNEKKEELDRFQREQENWRKNCDECGEAFIGTLGALDLAMRQHMKDEHGE